ncbi:MAG: DegT/DnrJ/EryC1/StrS family aminotransferase [Alphaproteobacteria bacterium]|nr:DegT/DnrJ/EryC1/StrS family aminotransferase [Alphaproteobacteria bacterium]
MGNNSIPALLGGPKINPDKPFRFNSAIGAEEAAAVQEVIASKELSGFIASPGEPFWGGPKVRMLQDMFCQHFGVKHAVAVNSATSGLHCAMMATGIGPGDEVITSPYSMSATSTTVLMTGAVPIFADIEADTFGLDPISVEANITPQTKAICAVNIFGHPARLTELRAIADKHGLLLIEDNSQAPDAIHQGRKTGTIGHMGIFSFNRHKTMQSGEGGIVITDHPSLFEKMALFRNHGEAVVDAMGIEDIVNTAGLNLRMTEMEAAVAIEQFKKLSRLNSERIALAKRLDFALAGIDGLISPKVVEGDQHVYYMYVMKFDEATVGMPRELFAEAMLAEGLFIRAGYLRPNYLEPLYQKKICFGSSGFPFTANPRGDALRYYKGLCPTCERLQEREIIITAIMQPPQTEEDMDLWADGAQKVIAARDQLLQRWKAA